MKRKKSFLAVNGIVAAALCLSFAGCEEKGMEAPSDSLGVKLLVKTPDVKTKAVWSEADKAITWENNDPLSVFAVAAGSDAVTEAKLYRAVDKGGFYGDLDIEERGAYDLDFIFPAKAAVAEGKYSITLPSKQHMANNSFDNDALFLAGQEKNVSLEEDETVVETTLDHVFGYLRLAFDDVPEEFAEDYASELVDNVKITSADGDAMAGDYILSPDDLSVNEAGNGTPTVDVDGDPNTVIKDFVCCAVLNPGTYGNVEIIVTTVNNEFKYTCSSLAIERGKVAVPEAVFEGSTIEGKVSIDLPDISDVAFSAVGGSKVYTVNANIPWKVSASTDMMQKTPSVTKLDETSFEVSLPWASHFFPDGMNYTITVEPEDKETYPDEGLVKTFTVNQACLDATLSGCPVTQNGGVQIQTKDAKKRVMINEMDGKLFKGGSYSFKISKINEGIGKPQPLDIRAYKTGNRKEASVDFTLVIGEGQTNKVNGNPTSAFFNIAGVAWSFSGHGTEACKLALSENVAMDSVDELLKDSKEVLFVMKSVTEGSEARKLHVKCILVKNDDTLVTLIDGFIEEDPYQLDEGKKCIGSQLYFGFNLKAGTGNITIDSFQYSPDWIDPRAGI